jgi:hypothetical protein
MSAEDKDGGAAFPSLETFQKFDEEKGRYVDSTSGMTLRDYFAAAAMQGIIAAPTDTGLNKDSHPEEIAVVAFHIADAMLEARKQ